VRLSAIISIDRIDAGSTRIAVIGATASSAGIGRTIATDGRDGKTKERR
jgi:hypothetical protein